MSSSEPPADSPAPESTPATPASPPSEPAASTPVRKIGGGQDAPPPAEPTATEDKKKRFPGCLVLVLLLLIGAGVFVWKLPVIVESRIYAYLDKQDWERKELTVESVGFSQLEIQSVDLANAGWEVKADSLTLSYSIWKVLSTWRADLAEIAGLQINLDLAKMEEEKATGEDTDVPVVDEPVKLTLKALADSLPVNLIQLSNPAQIVVARGEATQDFQLEGAFAFNGPMEFQVTGEGVTPASLSLTGNVAASTGSADLDLALDIEAFSPLLEHFSPDWAESLGEGTVIALGKAQLTGLFPFRGNKAQFETLEGTIELENYEQNGFKAGATTVTFAQVEGSAFAVSTGMFDLSYGGETVKTVCELEAEVGSGKAWRAADVQGALKVASATLFGVPINPFEMPIEGTIANLQFRGLQLFSPNYPDLALSGFKGAVKELGTEEFRFDTLGSLLLRIPGMMARQPSEDLEGAGALSITTEAELDSLSADLKIGANNGPVIYEKDSLAVEANGGLTVDGVTSEEGEFSVDGALDVKRIAIKREDTELSALTGLKVTAKLSGDTLTMTGEGQLDGGTFPIESNYVFGTGEEEGAVTGEYAVGPLVLENVSWIGEFVEGLKDVEVSGTLESKGKVKRSADGRDSGGPVTLQIRNGKVVYPNNLLTASGISTDIGVKFNPFGFDETIRLKATKVTSGDFEMRNVSLTITPLDNGGARIVALGADLWGGRLLVTKPFVIPADRKNFACQLLIRSIDSQELVSLIPQFDGNVEARVSGNVPFKVTNGRVAFLDGSLTLDEGQEASLQYDATGLLTDGIKSTNKRQLKLYQDAEKALGDLVIQELNANIYGPDTPSESRVIVKVRGESREEQRSGLLTISKIPVDLNLIVDDDVMEKLEDSLQKVYREVLVDVSVSQ